MGIEALSRGATTVAFVEANPLALLLLKKNLVACQLMDRANIHAVRTETYLAHPGWWGGRFDVVFADPPYANSQELEALRHVWEVGLVTADGAMVIEQNVKAELPASFPGAMLIRRYVYGDTALFLYGGTAAAGSQP